VGDVVAVGDGDDGEGDGGDGGDGDGEAGAVGEGGGVGLPSSLAVARGDDGRSADALPVTSAPQPAAVVMASTASAAVAPARPRGPNRRALIRIPARDVLPVVLCLISAPWMSGNS
jgi:hypothetical protein